MKFPINQWRRRLPRTLRSKRSAIQDMSDDEYIAFRRSLLKKPRPSRSKGAEARNAKLRRLRMLRRRQRAASAFRQPPRVRNLSKSQLTYRPKECSVLTSFIPDRDVRWKKLPARRTSNGGYLISLKNFSLVDNPRGTIEALLELAKAECTETEVFINFDDDQCLDITPFLIFGRMQVGLSPVIKGGLITHKIQKLISAVKLTEFLQMTPFNEIRETEKIWAFHLQERAQLEDAPEQVGPQQRDRVIGHFVQSVNEWLSMPEIGQALSKEGQGLVAGMITEALDNAEGHSSMISGAGGWAVAGFMTKRVFGDKERYFCSVGILSLGDTIADSFRDCHPKIRTKLDRYLGSHGGMFARLSDASLRTVCALQDGITSDWHKGAEGEGGVGFQEVIDFINDLGGTDDIQLKPRLTIISGKTCIQMRYPYICGKRSSDNAAAPRTLWFNEGNTPNTPPDEKFVYELPAHLPGTAISMAFTLDPAHLTRTVGEDQDDEDN